MMGDFPNHQCGAGREDDRFCRTCVSKLVLAAVAEDRRQAVEAIRVALAHPHSRLDIMPSMCGELAVEAVLGRPVEGA